MQKSKHDITGEPKIGEMNSNSAGRTRLFFLLMIAWMIVIFWFSSLNAADSTEQSNTIGLLIGRLFVPGFSSWNEASRMAFADSIDFLVRKCAHASEYAVLAVFSTNFVDCILVYNSKISQRNKIIAAKILLSLAICFVYACTDEVHQYFVPGRACRFFDVMIDSCGAFAGIIVTLIVGALIDHLRHSLSGRQSNRTA